MYSDQNKKFSLCKLNEPSMSSNVAYMMTVSGACLTSFGIMFLTEEEENERSPCVALLCAGLLRRGMVYELERVLP